MDNEESLPNADDVQVDGQTEAQLLDAVLANSELAQQAGIVPLPQEEEAEDGPVESEEQEDQDSEEAVSEDEGEEVESEEDVTEDEDATEEVATQEADVYTADDLDLDAKVSVKIDGEESEVSFGDLLKGYTTEQSLSKKGRELGEARKALDNERTKKLDELEKVASATAAIIGKNEEGLAKEYHDIEAKIETARSNGDTYEVNELKDKRELVQKQYWTVRNQREGMVKAVEEQREKLAKENWEKSVKHFQDTIPTLIPDFNEDVATKIREFAISEGIDPVSLDTITDPAIVKFVDDFRRLKETTSKGAARRKTTPAKKALPTKKPKSPKKKAQDKANTIRAKAFAKDSTKADQDAFLRQLASNSLKL